MNYATKHKLESLTRILNDPSSTPAEISGAELEAGRLLERSNPPAAEPLDPLNPKRKLPESQAPAYRPELDDLVRQYVETPPRKYVMETRNPAADAIARSINLALILGDHANRAEQSCEQFIDIFERTNSDWLKITALNCLCSYVAFHSAVFSAAMLARIENLYNHNPETADAAVAASANTFFGVCRRHANAA
jgi:hypothetical protein